MKITKERIKSMQENSQRSKLWDFKDEIEALRDQNIPFRLIKEWLEEHQVATTVQNIRQFYLRSKKSKTGLPKSINNESNKSASGMFDNLK